MDGLDISWINALPVLYKQSGTIYKLEPDAQYRAVTQSVHVQVGCVDYDKGIAWTLALHLHEMITLDLSAAHQWGIANRNHRERERRMG